jgi:hypothetical protein
MKRNKRPNYSAWDIQQTDFPKNGSIEEKIKFILGYGVLAPSTHNTQPWLFVIEDNSLMVTPNSGLTLMEADNTGRNLFISLGACVFNIQVAASHFGMSTKLSFEVSPKTKLIRVEFSNQELTSDSDLFDQITKRYSEKRVFNSTPLTPKQIKSLAVNPPGVKLSLVTENKDIHKLADLVYEASLSYATNRSFANELASWMRLNNTKKYDGMTGEVSGLSTPRTFLGIACMKLSPSILKPFSKKYKKLVNASHACGLISTEKDDWKSWVYAGIAYQELGLRASVSQLSLGPMAAVIERETQRDLLKEIFADSQNYPQAFFRIVTAQTQPVHTPRRKI